MSKTPKQELHVNLRIQKKGKSSYYQMRVDQGQFQITLAVGMRS